MMFDWQTYRQQIAQRMADIDRASPETLRGYRALSSAGEKADLLGAKTRELIAIAVGVTRQCDGCIAVHTDAALKAGATKDEIIEALGVAVAVNAGAAFVFSTRAVDAVLSADA
ncbi:MAG TPA: carboxymuconolactone decarboxylase family protein [Gemmatimonadaceae bacterium]|nr:carboxymuconolactone decarboxylase family protein [Gemmatimonadaceae bacterium]HRQ77376.1 carboxymuconolactone decarboxylase family protein [Gemmatimonadaceae bacterium]